MDPINNMLSDWLVQVLGTSHFEITEIPGDASTRRYVRVLLPEISYVVMLNKLDPQAQSELERFITISELLSEKEVIVPEVLSQSEDGQFVLLSDLGQTQYVEILNEKTADLLYRDALTALLKMQKRVGKDLNAYRDIVLPLMDQDYMLNQMNDLFWEWFIHRFLGLSVDPCLRTQLEETIQAAIKLVECQPKVFTHVDFHVRNLMVLSEYNPGVLDFQDAMWGPLTYDLTSLFQDRDITWSRHQIEVWLRQYYVRLVNTDAVLFEFQKPDFKTFLTAFDLTALQRHLKNLGTFARLHLRDHKSDYLQYIPILSSHISAICTRHSEYSVLKTFFQNTVFQAFYEKMHHLFLEQSCEP